MRPDPSPQPQQLEPQVTIATTPNNASMTRVVPDHQDTQPFNVVLFGWANGKPGHVAKYQAAYPPGCHFAIMPLVVWDASKDPGSLIHQAQPIVDFLTKHGHIVTRDGESSTPSDRGLILHALSNGGVHGLAIVLAHLAATGSRLCGLRGVILDCAPSPTGQRTVANGARLFASLLGLGPLPTRMARVVFYTGFSLQALVAKVFGWRPQLNKNRDMLLAHPELSGVPKLILYSSGDGVVDYKQVEWVVARLVAQMVHDDVQRSLPPATEVVGGGSVEAFRVMTATRHEGARTVTVERECPDSDPSKEIVQLLHCNKMEGPHGGLVAAVRFPSDALHVQLIRGYPKQYGRVVNAYLAKL